MRVKRRKSSVRGAPKANWRVDADAVHETPFGPGDLANDVNPP